MLNYSRPHLVEFVDSEEIVISNLTFLNSPAWSIHPVYCRYAGMFCKDINCSFLFCLMSPWIAILLTYMIFFSFNSDVMVRNVTIQTSLDAPLIDGIVPGKATNVFLHSLVY
jgi:polygalacturonase